MSHYDCPCMEKCPLHWAMSRIGGKWKVQILCSVANAGTIRYNALRAKLDGISNTVLSAALRELEGDGLGGRPGAAAGLSGGAGAGGVQRHGALHAPAAGAGESVRLGRGGDGRPGRKIPGIGGIFEKKC